MAERSPLFRRPAVTLTVAFVSSLAAMMIFWELRNVEPDIGSHRIHILSALNGDAEWPPNFLYYVLVAWVGWLLGDPTQLVLTSSVFLTVCVCAKALLTYKFFEDLAPNASSPAVLFAVLAMLTAFAVPWPMLLGATANYFLGSLTTNVWHNSTTIFLMPFALAVFILQSKAFEAGTTAHLRTITALTVVSIVAKPSFFFAYAPATLVWALLYRHRLERPALWGVPVAAGLLLVVVLYFAIYQLEHGNVQDSKTGLALAPFLEWTSILPGWTIPISLVSGLMVPILYLALGFRPRRPVWFGYAGLLTVFAVLVFVLLTETGARATHGNFYWQVVVSSFILHTVILSELLEAHAAGEKPARVWICLSAYGLMVASGVIYVARFFRDDMLLPF